jgi:hypothetical protein
MSLPHALMYGTSAARVSIRFGFEGASRYVYDLWTAQPEAIKAAKGRTFGYMLKIQHVSAPRWTWYRSLNGVTK